MKKIIQLKLKILAKLILAKYKPDVVGITGSVGKTSAKDAIYSVLKSKYNTRRNIKNYNNEIGVPLTIIGTESPGKNLFGWFLVFIKALILVLFKNKNYPKILVLEMGVDRPGDMKYLTSIVKCRVGVMTTIGESHLEFFKTLEDIKNEKSVLIESIPEDGLSVINFDDKIVKNIQVRSKARVITFGMDKRAKLSAQNIVSKYNFNPEESLRSSGIDFKLKYQGSVVPVAIYNYLGDGATYSALIASAVGVFFGISLTDIAMTLNKQLILPKGRMNLLKGIRDSLIIDDTYNSSPQSVMVGQKVVKEFKLIKDAKKFMILGDMLELGSASIAGHEKVGKYAVSCGVDELITIGERSRGIARGAKEAGMKESDMFHFSTSGEAGLFIRKRIKRGDLVFVKGSQGMRMEKIVKEIIINPLRSKELLVRQGKGWE